MITHKEQTTQEDSTAEVVDLYCRVSTDDQEDNTSLDEQEAAGRQWCKEHGKIVGMVHREVFTGYQYRERKKLDLMRQRYRDKKIKGVVIRTLDRLSRSQVHNAILMEEMEHYEIKLYCVKESIDDTPMGKFIRMILSFVAEMEREKIMDRSMTGRLNKAKEGKIGGIGGIKPRYGWKWNDPIKKDYLILDEDRVLPSLDGQTNGSSPVSVLQWMAEKYADGMPCQTIGKKLTEDGIPVPSGAEEKEWSNKTIRRFLTDPRMTGKNAQCFTHPNKKAKQNFDPVDLPDGTYPAIISEELYARIMKRAETNKEEASRNGQNPENYLLRAGFIRCAECNHAMTGVIKRDSRWKKEYLVYYCQRTPACTGHYVPSVPLDTEVWNWMVQLADHIDLIEEAIKLATSNSSVESNLKAVEATLRTWEETAENYEEDLKDNTLRGKTRASIRKSLDDANEMIERLESERQQILIGVYDKNKEKEEYEKLLEWCKTVKEAREELSYKGKRDFLRMLGAVVFVDKRNRNFEEMSYNIKVALPAIQAIIYQNTDVIGGNIVGHTLTRKR